MSEWQKMKMKLKEQQGQLLQIKSLVDRFN